MKTALQELIIFWLIIAFIIIAEIQITNLNNKSTDGDNNLLLNTSAGINMGPNGFIEFPKFNITNTWFDEIYDNLTTNACWDLNGDHTCNPTLEDTNRDGLCTVDDCDIYSSFYGPQGNSGPQGSSGPQV